VSGGAGGGTAAGGRMAGHAVRCERVRFAYGGAEVLRGVSLDIAAGSSVALLGPNGAGKTTLTRLVMALRRPASGRVWVGDWDTATRRPHEMAQRVGYVFQHADQQLFERTVRRDVAFGPHRLGRPAGAGEAALEELGLAGVADVHPYDLPLPVRKLVALAGVLAMAPGVLVLDEPTAGLDRAGRDRVIAALRRRAAAGVTALVVSHDVGFVAEVADRVVVLREGAVAADAPARTLLSDAAALALLGLAPPPAAELAAALGLPGAPIRVAECAAALQGVRWREA
jgi:energy-coupling factor transporter ATP-binding protein EcfA2